MPVEQPETPSPEQIARMRPRMRTAVSGIAAAALAAGGLLAASTSAVAEPAPTFYVNSGGFDSPNCGSIVQQCATIQAGIDHAPAGATVQVSAGTFNGTVAVTKAITLQGAGAGSTTIDGTGLTGGNGLVDVQSPGGDVTISGFTITNPFASGNGEPFDLSATDPGTTDTLTISHNTFTDNADDAVNSPIGVNVSDTAAHVSITGNDFSGLFQGALLEGTAGPVSVDDNVFHDMSDSAPYPAEGVYFLSDKAVTPTDQDVTGNTFRDYGGIGIAYSAGYSQGGCTDTTCKGSVSGSITGNTFALTANADGNVDASAIRLRATNAGDNLDLTVGGNSGTVAAGTLPIQQSPGAGSITLTPGTTANAIVPTPAPTLSVDAPASVTPGAEPVAFSGTTTNPAAGDAISNARYAVRITGTSGIAASQISLKYEVSEGTFADVPLTGTASSDGAITGYFGPTAGFSLPAGATLTTPFTLAIAAGAPKGALSTAVSLQQVSAGAPEGAINDAINTIATAPARTTTVNGLSSTASFTVSPASPTVAQSPVVNVTVSSAGNTTGGSVLVRANSLSYYGTVGANGKASVTIPKYTTAGSHLINVYYQGSTYTAAAPVVSGTITVAKVTSTFTTSVSPAKPSTKVSPKVTVSVTASGASLTGGKVTVEASSVNHTATLSAGKVTITLPPWTTAGAHLLKVSFLGTATATALSKTYTVTVVKG